MQEFHNNINTMMSYRGFIFLDEGIYKNINNHLIYVVYIKDKSGVEERLLHVKNLLENFYNENLHHIIIYYDKPRVRKYMKTLDELVQSLLYTLDTKFYFEIFTVNDFDINPLESIYSPDDLTIYLPGSSQTNELYSALSRFSTISTNGDLNMSKILQTDPLVKYLNLSEGSIVVIKYDRGFKSRFSNLYSKILTVVNNFNEEDYNMSIKPDRKRGCNCTLYNNLL